MRQDLAHVRTRAGIAALILGLSLATVYAQYRGLAPIAPGGDYRLFVERDQVLGHAATLHGEGGDPWQYRLLSEWLVDVPLRVARDGLKLSHPALWAFLGFRVLQNVAIFGLAWALLRRLGMPVAESILGLGLIAWAMTQALYSAGLAFNTYTDVVAYLAAALLVLSRRWWWLVPLTVVATLNRETAGLIPVMALGLGWARRDRRALSAGAAALAAFAVTYASVRLAVGPGDLVRPYGKDPGLELLRYNVGRGVTWDNLFRTVTVVPLLAALSLRRWPRELKLIGLAIVPLWMLIHLLGAVLAETRLVLVPYVVVLVPGALLALRRDPPVDASA
jgi:hypothetical protein